MALGVGMEPEVEGEPDQPKSAPPRGPGAQPRRGSAGSSLFLLLVFGFGAAAGLLLAFVGAGLIAESGALILTVFLSALVVVGVLGGLVFLFRKAILRSLFGVAETQVELFADPLTRVAQGALARDAPAATQAARDLVALAFARYSWLSARRWIITSLTALIAAMAALAGTALLFRQNALLQAQNDLLTQQNTKVEAQTILASQGVQLAEAARNAQLAVEITAIAAEMGKAADTAADRAEAAATTGATVAPLPALVNIVDPTSGLDRALMLRIVSISRALRPYRFLDLGLRPGDDSDRMRVAMLGRRADLPRTYARLAAARGWAEDDGANRLIDRPASPERGQLLQVLLSGGIVDFNALNLFGLDLSFALLQNGELKQITATRTQLSYADLTGSYIVACDLGGSVFDNTRFRQTVIQGTTFAEVGPDRIRPPFRAKDAPISTPMHGADFGGAFLQDVDFTSAQLLAAHFDRAVLAGVNFRGTTLSAADMRGAVILRADFAGADLRSVDFDGAILFGADPLGQLASTTERFAADRYTAAPATMDEVMESLGATNQLTSDDVARITGGQTAFRITRVKPFDD
jgi:uncharacterized protein YjbI with pentapeptide repeats